MNLIPNYCFNFQNIPYFGFRWSKKRYVIKYLMFFHFYWGFTILFFPPIGNNEHKIWNVQNGVNCFTKIFSTCYLKTDLLGWSSICYSTTLLFRTITYENVWYYWIVFYSDLKSIRLRYVYKLIFFHFLLSFFFNTYLYLSVRWHL